MPEGKLRQMTGQSPAETSLCRIDSSADSNGPEFGGGLLFVRTLAVLGCWFHSPLRGRDPSFPAAKTAS